jgi:hypothetical protein
VNTEIYIDDDPFEALVARQAGLAAIKPSAHCQKAQEDSRLHTQVGRRDKDSTEHLFG